MLFAENGRIQQPSGRAGWKIEFPTLAHFIDDVCECGLATVRLDTFEDARQSELSFVYYVTLTLFVTAHHPAENLVYEYKEPLGSAASTSQTLSDDDLLQFATLRAAEVEELLVQAGLRVRSGRFTAPDVPYM